MSIAAMRNILALVFLFAACASDPVDTLDAQPDSAPSVVYPCAVAFYETCAAAKHAAEVVCDWKIGCDPLVTLTREECIAQHMADLCSATQCNSDAPYDRTELDACLATYGECDGGPLVCHL